MIRDGLVAELEVFLEAATANDLRGMLDPAGVRLAIRLSQVAEPSDRAAWHLLAILHWTRYQLLPDGADDDDLRASLVAFAMLLPLAPDLVPDPVQRQLRALAANPELVPDDHSGRSDIALRQWAAVALGEQLSRAATRLLGAPQTADDLHCVDEAISLFQRALQLLTPEHPWRSGRLGNLCLAWRHRFERSHDLLDLEQSIAAGRGAVRFAKRTGQVDPAVLSSLGLALTARFKRRPDLAEIDDAVGLGRLAASMTPATNPDRAGYLANVTNALRARFEHTTDLADIDAAVRAAEESVAAAVATRSRLLPMCLSNLGMAQRARYDRTGLLADLDGAIAATRSAANLTRRSGPGADRDEWPGGELTFDAGGGPGDPRLTMLHNLSGLLQRRYERSFDVEALEESLELSRIVAAATPERSADRAMRLSHVSTALQLRFDFDPDAATIDEAITFARLAVAAASLGHPDRAACLSNLGVALEVRHSWGGARSDLDDSIEAFRETLTTDPRGHATSTAALGNLSNALQARFDRSHDRADLDAGLIAARQALADTPTDDPHRAVRLATVATMMRVLADRTGAVAALDEAIQHARRAAQHPSGDQIAAAFVLMTLGDVLTSRYQISGAVADLVEAVAAIRAALALTPPRHVFEAGLLSSLATAQELSFSRTGDPEELSEAVAVGRRALDAVPLDHLDWPSYTNNLCSALVRQFQQTENVALLDEAVAMARQAIDRLPSDAPERSSILSNLGTALDARFDATKAPDDLADAIAAGQEAIAATPADDPTRSGRLHNLGQAQRSRYEQTGSPEHRQEALTTFRQAAGVDFAPALVRCQSARRWADLATAADDWQEALRAHDRAFELLPMVTDLNLAPSDRQYHLERLQGLGPDAAVAHLDGGRKPRRGEPAVKAWMALDSGRGVMLSQALNVRDDLAPLRKQPEHAELVAEVEDLRASLNDETALKGAIDQEERRRRAHQWRDVVERVRRAGLKGFVLPPDPAELFSAASGGTLVAVNVTRAGCGALIHNAHGADYLPLPDLTRSDAIARTNRFLSALRPNTREEPNQEAIVDALAWLWRAIAQPVLEHLGHRATPVSDQPWPRIWWIPTGPLTVLPLHAAGDRTTDPRAAVLERVVSSYAPTARLLHEARRRRTPGEGAGGLVVGLNDNKARSVDRLAHAEREATEVHEARRVSTPALLAHQATRAATVEALAEAGWVHFACHAMANQLDPAESRLVLYDDDLAVRELRGITLPHTDLAYLSACTTATVSTKLPDEMIHIASAFQIAGVRHTIATLWPIGDQVAASLAVDVHKQLEDGVPPSTALHQAALARSRFYPRHPTFWAAHVHYGP